MNTHREDSRIRRLRTHFSKRSVSGNFTNDDITYQGKRILNKIKNKK